MIRTRARIHVFLGDDDNHLRRGRNRGVYRHGGVVIFRDSLAIASFLREGRRALEAKGGRTSSVPWL